MTDRHQRSLQKILTSLSEAIDVSPAKYRDARERYDTVGSWLGEEDSELAPFKPTIYPQGSFALGTAIRPLGDDEYDVDAVCLLERPPDPITQQVLKRLVGDRLRHPRSRYRQMLEPPTGGRRCWTIRYADASKFHLDVLPAIPDDFLWLLRLGVPREWAETAIRLTDRKTWDIDPQWPRSNPKGFAAWFRSRMETQIREAKSILALDIKAEAEEIPDYEVRTPLQRLVQLLKRHRDIHYNGDADKPVSIIITTLAAQAYDDGANLFDALQKVISEMPTRIVQREGEWWVANPVNPHENFADKWNEPGNQRKVSVFHDWLRRLEREWTAVLQAADLDAAMPRLRAAFGARDVNTAWTKCFGTSAGAMAGSAAGAAVVVPRVTERPPVPQVELPPRPPRPWKPR